MNEIQDLKKSVDIVQIVHGYLPGGLEKFKGHEHRGICPFHTDTKPSLTVNDEKQIFSCFACGARGDVIDFLVQHGRTVKEALAELRGISEKSPGVAAVRESKKTTERKIWAQITPAPNPGQITHYTHGKPSRFWQYKTADGHLVGLVCRFDLPDGGKEVLPLTYRTDGSQKGWRWQGFDRPRPLYNLPDLAARPNDFVLVVEGEKTADAAALLFPQCVVTCWIGGSRAISHTDWTPLHGRRVVLCPDADQPGFDAMLELSGVLLVEECKLWICPPPADVPKGWDLADAKDWTVADAKNWVNALKQPLTGAEQKKKHLPETLAVKNEKPPKIEVEKPKIEPQKRQPEPSRQIDNFADSPYFHNGWFRFLGFEKDDNNQRFCFFSFGAKSVLRFSATSLSSKANLMTLAPLHFWEQSFPGSKSFSVDMAVQTLIELSNRVGVFSPGRVRGRGAWMDDGRVVLHVGDQLIVDGRPKQLQDFPTRYIYESGEFLDFHFDQPLPPVESAKLLEMCQLLNWERPINGFLLAGWCVVAPICGALKWRPHIWLTGGAGTGKTWVFSNIVRRVLGNMALAVQSKTSEAGLRQMLASDSLPVVFDEAEGENRAAVENMENVLGLMRSSSAADGGVLAKGTVGGTAKTYQIRSCFAFASIGYQVSQQSDRTRVTLLALTTLPDEKQRGERWERLKFLHAETMTENWISGLQSRTIQNVSTILKNAETFAAAAAAELGGQRYGDQIGYLLAGAYSLRRSDLISFDDAVAWLKGQNLNEERLLDGTRDEKSLFKYLAEIVVRVDGIEGSAVERSLGELVLIAANVKKDATVWQEPAVRRLSRFGFAVNGNYLVVSAESEQIRRWLMPTAWQKNYSKILLRLDGALPVDSFRFSSGVSVRGVKIPISNFQ